jgi:hypothetical protein
MSEIFSFEISVPNLEPVGTEKRGTEISNEKISDMKDYYMFLDT